MTVRAGAPKRDGASTCVVRAVLVKNAATALVLVLSFVVALAGCSSETTETLPVAPDAGMVCGSMTWSSSSSGSSTGGTYVLDQCPNGKSYRLECDAAQCTCKTNGVVTSTVARSSLSFSDLGRPSLTSVYAACRWP
jgi:hypothetical protein